ncbi:winged helix-turn-helix domain-containing protein [Pseudomonas sp. AM8]|nr:winged helix-turn-helix domain-containing protein [Pseudomonas sp. AM8]
MTETMPRIGVQEVRAAWIIRTARPEGSQAHFHPERYQLVLSREDVQEKIDLGYSGSRLLERLLQVPGEVVRRDELLVYAWTDRVVGQGSLNQQIYSLRQVLGDEKKRDIIQTLPRRGYMFNPKFLVNLNFVTDQSEADFPTPPVLPRRKNRTLFQQRIATLMIAATTLAILALIVFAYIYHELFHSQVLVAERDISNKHFVYTATTPHALEQLRNDTGGLTERLAGLVEQPVQFRLGANAGFFELLCVQRDSTRWMMINRAQLTKVKDEQLRSCLQ